LEHYQGSEHNSLRGLYNENQGNALVDSIVDVLQAESLIHNKEYDHASIFKPSFGLIMDISQVIFGTIKFVSLFRVKIACIYIPGRCPCF